MLFSNEEKRAIALRLRTYPADAPYSAIQNALLIALGCAGSRQSLAFSLWLIIEARAVPVDRRDEINAALDALISALPPPEPSHDALLRAVAHAANARYLALHARGQTMDDVMETDDKLDYALRQAHVAGALSARVERTS